MNEMSFEMFKLKSAGFCCTQIMIKMALEEEETENDDLIRIVNGFCNGIGGTQRTCGVLLGGVGIIGLYAGKGKETEYPKQGFFGIVREFTEWFENEFESTECADIVGVFSLNDGKSNENFMLRCGDILTKSYIKVREILEENDFEFGSRER